MGIEPDREAFLGRKPYGKPISEDVKTSLTSAREASKKQPVIPLSNRAGSWFFDLTIASVSVLRTSFGS